MNRKNRYTYIAIPFLLGYEYTYKKYGINIRAGLGISFLLKERGRYINYEITDFEQATLNKTLVSFIFSPELNYHLGERMRATLTPVCIVKTTNILKNQQVIQRYTNYSVQAGVKYIFE